MEENKKGLTLDDIAELIKSTEKNLEAKIESSVDGLARITQNNFLKLETEVKAIKSDTENIKADLNKKVDKIEYNTLEYRVKRLEEKAA